MDIQMPGMDGFEVIQAIRGDPELEATPIIALTALAMKGDRERCLEAGADEYLTKPIDEAELLARVTAMLRLRDAIADRDRAVRETRRLRAEVEMLSGLGHMATGSFWEGVLQPAVGSLIMSGNDLDQTNDPERRSERPLANGQFILVRRDTYDAVGGHEAVAGAVLDDVGMATAVTAAGFSYNLLMLRDLFSCRMYDSLGALWEGWTKNLFTGLRRSWGLLVVLSLWLLLFSVVPFVLPLLALPGWVGSEWLAWGVGLSALILLVRLYLDRAYQMDVRFGPTQPLAVLMLIALLWSSALHTVRGTTSWKGRKLALDPNEGRRSKTGDRADADRG